MKKILVALSALALIAVLIVIFAFNKFANQASSSDPTEVIYEVQQGKSFQMIARELEEKNLIKNAQIFSIYAKVTGLAGKMRVGEYSLRRSMLPSEILKTINSGKSIGRLFTVPEGMNIFEISEAYEKQGFGTQEQFMSLIKDRKLIKEYLGKDIETLEGYLFPETYSLTKYTDTKTLILNMLKKFDSVWKEIEEEAQKTSMTKHEIVTLASIIEKETGAPEERPLISSVFHNRMNRGMMLQTDPTVLYGKALATGKMIISITRADLLTPTKYNTYVIKGLPPGPIANPSKEALLAAIKPATSEYLFFVSENEGRHTFSKTYQEHAAAVKKHQLNPKAREGKSWRNMKK